MALLDRVSKVKMADSDEAAIHSNDPSAPIETDLSDETQDFRFLNNLTL